MPQPYASPASADKTDLNTGWIERYAPRSWQPYAVLMRLDRPIGVWLLLLPGWWSIALAAQAVHQWGQGVWMAALFAIGAVVMRGAGCVVNDLWDRKIDAQVQRTRTRPLVTGAVTPGQAVAFFFGLCVIGAAIVWQMNALTWWLAVASLPLIALYPVMKRVTWWPQLFLGLTFNFGALMGWAAVTGVLDTPALALYLAGIFWTLGYDTIYAQMDTADDARIGVKSTARLFGAYSRWAVGICYALATGGLWIGISAVVGSSWVLMVGMALVAAGFGWQVMRFEAGDARQCLRLFRANREQGLLILAVILAGCFL